MTPDPLLMREFADLNQEKRQLEARLQHIKARQEALTGPILEYFIAVGQTRATIHGETLYTAQETWAKAAPGQQDRLRRWLQRHGLRDFILPARANTSSLSAWVREHRRDGLALPPSLVPLLEITDLVKLKGVASNGHASRGPDLPILAPTLIVEEDVP
jgi:hypothetical protein